MHGDSCTYFQPFHSSSFSALYVLPNFSFPNSIFFLNFSKSARFWVLQIPHLLKIIFRQKCASIMPISLKCTSMSCLLSNLCIKLFPKFSDFSCWYQSTPSYIFMVRSRNTPNYTGNNFIYIILTMVHKLCLPTLLQKKKKKWRYPSTATCSTWIM